MRLKIFLSTLTALLCGSCLLAAACTAKPSDSNGSAYRAGPVGNEPAGNTPSIEEPDSEPPPKEQVDRWNEWIHESPMRADMRSMWVHAGLITGNGPDIQGAELIIVEYAAFAIARRAGRMAEFWKRIKDDNRAAAAAAIRGDWDTAYELIDEVHHTCGDCHREYWAPAPWGMKAETLRRWEQDQSVLRGAPWGEQEFTSPQRYRDFMKRMQKRMSAAYTSIYNEDLDATKTETLALHELVNGHLLFFESVERYATNMAEAAETGDRVAIQSNYNAMRNQCMGCHAAFAQGIAVDPVPWPKLD